MAESLLVELLTEELPPKALDRLGEAFAEAVHEGLLGFKLTAERSREAFATPRRLSVLVGNVLSRAEDSLVDEKIMPVAVALDPEGQPTPALLKKLASRNIPESEIPNFEIRQDGKAECFFFRNVVRGVSLDEVLESVVEAAVKKLPIPKLMRWGDSEHQFVRPVHGLVMMHGNRIVPGKILGLGSGGSTLGHRFLSEGSIEIGHADDYESVLENEGRVIPSFGKRREIIRKKLESEAARLGAGINPTPGLLEEVTALVEWPEVYVGEFGAEFLEVPQECLILSMQQHQKYFPLLNPNGKLTNEFLIVSNMAVENPAHIVGGNQRVVRPRLSDAKFFYDQDRKKPLDSRILGLSKVVYHNKLGTLGERIDRVQAIARAIGHQLGGEVLSLQADQAALLSKSDLLTEMVGEFPELQGIMGRYYALHDGHSPEIAFAIEDHYKPRFAGDELPRNQVGLVVALADKLETLFGMFRIGQIPTGDKDPYALRRHAIGVIRMLIEEDLPLELNRLINWVSDIFDNAEIRTTVSDYMGGNVRHHGEHLARVPLSSTEDIKPSLVDFIYDRLSGNLREQGYSAQEVDAVLSLRPTRLSDIPKRLAAVRAFAGLPEAEALTAANKRVGNILKKAEGAADSEIDVTLLNEPAEKALHRVLGLIAPKADEAFFSGEYASSLQMLVALRNPVDEFFDNVMVNTEDPALRANRLALLARLHAVMNRIADLSRLAS